MRKAALWMVFARGPEPRQYRKDMNARQLQTLRMIWDDNYAKN